MPFVPAFCVNALQKSCVCHSLLYFLCLPPDTNHFTDGQPRTSRSRWGHQTYWAIGRESRNTPHPNVKGDWMCFRWFWISWWKIKRLNRYHCNNCKFCASTPQVVHERKVDHVPDAKWRPHSSVPMFDTYLFSVTCRFMACTIKTQLCSKNFLCFHNLGVVITS